MAAFGHEEEEGRTVIIAGGGNIGLTLAEEIEQEHEGERNHLPKQGPATSNHKQDERLPRNTD